MKLIDLPTPVLLAELHRRLEVTAAARAELNLPAWATPVLKAVAAVCELPMGTLMDATAKGPAAVVARQIALIVLHQSHPERCRREIADLWGFSCEMINVARRALADFAGKNPVAAARAASLLAAFPPRAGHSTAPRGTARREQAPAQ